MMSYPAPNITVNVDITNPGQFFACCGLLELADRLWPAAEGWFDGGNFCMTADGGLSKIFDTLRRSNVNNTMTPLQHARLEGLSHMTKKQREVIDGAEDEKKALESLRRESPILLDGDAALRIDWFVDEYAGGSRFKTWAGQQSVLDIVTAMHGALKSAQYASADTIWSSARGIGLPFNFDSDLGGQGSAVDIGFSFDPLSGNEITRIEGTSKPALELLAFIGLQRFRPREIWGRNRFVYVLWNRPLPSSVASCAACQAVAVENSRVLEFRLLYRTKYLKSFLPAIPFQGDRDEQA